MSKKLGTPLLAMLILALAVTACGREPTPDVDATVQAAMAATQAVEPLAVTTEAISTPAPTPLPPTDTLVPTNTPIPTDTPAPDYKEPVTLTEVSGVGQDITENFEWPACHKAVLYWSVAPSQTEMASIIVNLHRTDTGEETTLVNESLSDVTSDITGSMLLPLRGGEYFFTTENTDEVWTLRVECQDGQAPFSTGIEQQGVGDSVTSNFKLPACKKSVFSWNVEAGDIGMASIIMNLVDASVNGYWPLADEFASNIAVLEGEALQPIHDGGVYFLTVENTDELWNVRWECRD